MLYALAIFYLQGQDASQADVYINGLAQLTSTDAEARPLLERVRQIREDLRHRSVQPKEGLNKSL